MELVLKIFKCHIELTSMEGTMDVYITFTERRRYSRHNCLF